MLFSLYHSRLGILFWSCSYIEDESTVIIMYEDLKEVKQMLGTDGKNTSEPSPWNLLKLTANGTCFWRSKIKLIVATSWIWLYKTALWCNAVNILWRKIYIVNRWWQCTSQVGNSFSRGSMLCASLSLYCFQNLTASARQIAGFFGFFPVAEQVQPMADRTTFQAVMDKAQDTDGAVGSILFCKGKFTRILQGWWMVALHLGQTGINLSV